MQTYKKGEGPVSPAGFEPAARGLRIRCSTAELWGQSKGTDIVGMFVPW